MLAIKTLAALGKLQHVPLAARHDQIDRMKTRNSPDTGVVWNRARETFEAVDVMRLDDPECESLAARQATTLELADQVALREALRQVSDQVKNSSKLKKACERRHRVLIQMIEDPEISCAKIACQLQQNGMRVSKDTIEADRTILENLLEDALQDFIST
jgi:hypothetical protein